MDKLQYDSLYKFLVSLGMIMIALPIIAIVYLLNKDIQLVSRIDFLKLSKFSQQAICEREQLIDTFIAIFPYVFIVFELIGFALVGVGLWKWSSIQKAMDMKVKADAITNYLGAMKMSNSEVVSKMVSEANEASSVEDNNQTTNIESGMIKYAQVEDICYSYFSSKYARKYRFERNVQIGRWEYDFVAVANNSNIDLIFEIKYWRSIHSISAIRSLCQRVWNACVHYESSIHRNFRCIIVLVMPQEALIKTKKNIEMLFGSEDRPDISRIEFYCISESNLQNSDFRFDIFHI